MGHGMVIEIDEEDRQLLLWVLDSSMISGFVRHVYSDEKLARLRAIKLQLAHPKPSLVQSTPREE